MNHFTSTTGEWFFMSQPISLVFFQTGVAEQME
jgi:hypothetical protein